MSHYFLPFEGAVSARYLQTPADLHRPKTIVIVYIDPNPSPADVNSNSAMPRTGRFGLTTVAASRNRRINASLLHTPVGFGRVKEEAKG
jgi:hypothetical protein